MEILSHSFTPTPLPLHGKVFAGVMGAVEQGIAMGSNPFMIDVPMSDTDPDEVENITAGHTTTLPTAALPKGESIEISKYSEAGQLAEHYVLQPAVSVEPGVLPIAHMHASYVRQEVKEGEVEIKGVPFEATYYFFNNSSAVVKVRWSISELAEAWSPEGKNSFEFATSLGLGDHWTRCLLNAEGSAHTEEFLLAVDEDNAKYLIDFLNSRMESV